MTARELLKKLETIPEADLDIDILAGLSIEHNGLDANHLCSVDDVIECDGQRILKAEII